MSSSTGDELKAAVSARRDLGPDFEDAIVESFLDKMGQEVDRRVDERLATAAPSMRQVTNDKVADGQRLALAIVSMVMGTGATIAMAESKSPMEMFLIVWLGIVALNAAFTLGRRRS